MKKHWFDAYGLATKYTNQTGTAREIMAWYKTSQKNIRFDPEKKLFVL